MKKSIHFLSIPVVACCLSCTSGKVLPPDPILPVPEPKQVEWQQMETYAFIHFGLNTFNDREPSITTDSVCGRLKVQIIV